MKDPFNPNVKLPDSEYINISITEQHFKDSDETDALLSPLALAVKPYLREDSDILVTSKQVLYYDRKFDRSNIDIVLGKGRIAMMALPEDITKKLRDFETTGVAEPFEVIFPIPKCILDESVA